MTVFAAVVLLVGALFNFVTWPRFAQRVAADPRARDADGRTTTFFRVHIILLGIAVVIGVLSSVAAIALLVGA